ncbi:hypothetical protein EIN_053220 [Entamoeba invadens IP1]|uniref:hypothetical protein n=1 Tax=Entamoeba invadens IP1 TaxID=370355 RepID=UPI0002C3EAF1|nr:hypothetical protein EIN_053220 [Entamoeba invadens IP1]ELP93087.1 hypothetical protein EIN_053220 [Entamoeba invadens IP1]|eukprot:XP_004259858.1 hypothetical protein EIN_053220 [Entamoeba invadens IP1]
MSKRYKEERDYQSLVRAVCIVLLNQYGNVEVKRKSKKGSVALPFLRIGRLQFSENDCLNVKDFVKKRVQIQWNLDIENQMNETTALCRKKKNAIGESINFVVDLLGELGFRFKAKVSSGRNNTMKVDRVLEIEKQGLVLTKQRIIDIGLCVCDFIVKKTGEEKFVVFPKNDLILQKFMEVATK